MDTSTFLLVLCGSLLHASWNLVAKKLKGDLGVIWIGFSFAAILYTPLALLSQPFGEIPGKAWLFVGAAGLGVTVYLWGLGRAYAEGEISAAYPLVRGIGVGGTALIAPFILRQPLSFQGGVGILSVLIGILFLGFRRGRTLQEWKVFFYAALSGSITVCYSVVDSLAVHLVNPVFYNWAFTLCAMIFFLPVMAFHRREVGVAWKERKWPALFIGLSSMTVYILILFAFRSGVTSYVVALREVSILFGALLGWFFLKEKMTPQKIGGIAAILIGIFLIKMA